MVRRALVITTLAACHASSPAVPDGGGPTPDAGGEGLKLTWATEPIIPGSAGSNVTVSSMVIRVDSLRVIGDAGPGDPRTSKNTFQLSWAQGQMPAAIAFADAPTGLYSKLTLQANAFLVDYSYEVYGTVRIGDVTHDYKIHDRDPITATVALSTMLDPGNSATMSVRVNVADALSVINWSTLDNSDGGVLELDTFDAQMPTFRAKFTDSFESEGVHE
jgi:hypothetical protein